MGPSLGPCLPSGESKPIAERGKPVDVKRIAAGCPLISTDALSPLSVRIHHNSSSLHANGAPTSTTTKTHPSAGHRKLEDLVNADILSSEDDSIKVFSFTLQNLQRTSNTTQKNRKSLTTLANGVTHIAEVRLKERNVYQMNGKPTCTAKVTWC